MDEQTAIPVTDPGRKSAPCDWCGAKAVAQRTLEEARKTTTGVVPARKVWVCDAHAKSFDRAASAKGLWDERERLKKQVRDPKFNQESTFRELEANARALMHLDEKPDQIRRPG